MPEFVTPGRLTADIVHDVARTVGDVTHDALGWLPDHNYYGPIWVDDTGWVAPHGWAVPTGFVHPPGWYEPTRWDDHQYRDWCDRHYSGDHDWRGWENCNHFWDHGNWHGWLPDHHYFGPVWDHEAGWVAPHGWEYSHDFIRPPGWYEPTRWEHDHYRDWCDRHYSGDHDW
ncbi:MAG TPA: hypothetical protein VGH89_38710, partial [Pseudonocardia sp.]